MSDAIRHVYVHVPFCARRCSYCDFAIAVRREVPVKEYLTALSKELQLRAQQKIQDVETIYLGGGTPSIIGSAGLSELLSILQQRFKTATGVEVTLEANPEDVSERAVADWRAAGVTRVSLGVQSFNPEVLTWMHRVHDADAARRAARLIARGGFASWTLDLIFALPDELQRDWQRDLTEAIALEPPHISVYGLTVESHTPLARWVARGAASDVTEERYEREFLITHEMLSAAGFDHYEVSNYARSGHASRHNSAYWTGAKYAGFGPSAHSFDGAMRRWNTREYQAWRSALSTDIDPLAGSEVLTDEQRSLERVYLGLRTHRGLDIDAVPPEIVDKWREQEWAMVQGGRVQLTPRGWLRLDSLVGALTAYSNPC